MVTLADLGFCQNIICETILCTFNADGSPNAAPMGATLKNNRQVSLTLYNSSKTLQNLQTTRSATLNLTSNIEVYYKSALKEDGLPADWFESFGSFNAPKLKDAAATAILAIEGFEHADDLRTRVTGTVQQIEASKTYPQAYCRAMPAVLEAVIHATRIKALCGVKEEQAYVAKLAGLIQNCGDVVNRSAPDSHYAELMADLQQKIEKWRAKT